MEECLSKQTSSCIKGIMAICVLLHHIYLTSNMTLFLPLRMLFQCFGYLADAVFLFLSGYGLMMSFLIKKDDYIGNFFQKRIFPMYAFYIFMVVIYFTWDNLVGINISYMSVFKSLFFGDTIVVYGWFLQAIMLFYLAFWVIYKTKKKIKYIFYITAIYVILCFVCGLGSWWYVSIFCFPIGMCVAQNKSKICMFLANRKFVFFGASYLLIGAFYVIRKFSLGSFVNAITVSEFLTSFPLVMGLFSTVNILFEEYQKVIVNNFTKLLGKYSLEIYVIQGLFVNNTVFDLVGNSYVFILLALLATFLLVVPLKCIRGGINRKCVDVLDGMDFLKM